MSALRDRGRRRRARGPRGRRSPAPTRARASRCFEARPRLGGATWSTAAPGPRDRQRPARLPALLHGVPRLPRADRRERTRVALQRAARDPGARAGRPHGVAAPRTALPAPLHLAPQPAALRAALAARERLRRGAPRGARASSTSTIPRSTSARFGDWLARARPDRARAIERFWDLIALPTLNLPRGRGLARARRRGLPDRAAPDARRRRHRLGRGCRSQRVHADAGGARARERGARGGDAGARCGAIELEAGRRRGRRAGRRPDRAPTR